MNPDIAIKVEHVSKTYKIGVKKDSTLRESITGFFRKSDTEKKTTFDALNDISFEVKRGQSLGIIGKNGAGKSTLLKVLSQITRPSKGRIEINGRVASLLEVGTGFHPELTGRENVFLNGTLLGMTRREVQQKFDEIVHFSGVEKFIDTPVKHYSSGMYVRLAFAVAAHLEPEILIIDEVLAVGDAEFQKQCLSKMSEVSSSGRTILFVSHNLATLRSLCDYGILMHHGQLISQGYVQEVISDYNELVAKSEKLLETLHYFQDKLEITDFRINNSESTTISSDNGKMNIRFTVNVKQASHLELDIHLKKDDELVASYAPFVFGETEILSPGNYVYETELDLGNFRSGSYNLEFTFAEPFKTWYCKTVNAIDVEIINQNHHLFLNNSNLKWGSYLIPGKTSIEKDL